MKRAILGAMTTLLVHAHAMADVAQYPKRPDWDDVPAPMPPELLLVIVVALVIGTVAAMRRDRRV